MSGVRIHSQDEVRNFRDFGGYSTMDGRAIAFGRLLRSGHWAEAKSGAFELLRQMKMDVFIDLRRPAERSSQPNRLPAEMQIEQFSSGGGDMAEPPHVRFLRQGDLSSETVRAYMQSAYRRIPAEAHHQELFRQAILALGQNKTILIHCAAGKDRTGILAALILLLLGVDHELVMEDYLLTNKAVDIDGLLPGITRQIERKLQTSIPKGALYPMLGVESDFLYDALAVIGEPQHYAINELGLGDRDLDRMRDSLLP